MTRRTNARIAGFTFLFYIAVAMTGMILANRAIRGEGTAEKLASIAQHASDMIEWWNPELLVRKPDWLARNAATKFRVTWNGSRW